MNTVISTNAKVYPGMICDSVEFFLHENQLKAIQNGKIKTFAELSFATIEVLKEEINKDKEVKLALHEFHPTSDIKRIEQFAMCRFGGLDFQGDIKNGELQNGEYWPCPNHGKCPFEGLLCKLPVVNGQRLTKQEVDLIKLSSTDKTNDAIADDLGIPLGTLHQLKHKLYEKFVVQTKQELTKLSALINII